MFFIITASILFLCLSIASYIKEKGEREDKRKDVNGFILEAMRKKK